MNAKGDNGELQCDFVVFPVEQEYVGESSHGLEQIVRVAAWPAVQKICAIVTQGPEIVGSRLHELSALEAYQIQSLEKLAERTDAKERHRAKAAGELLDQFQTLTKTNEERRTMGKIPLTLFFPKAGGPLFLAARDGNPVQADLNAAANLGLRAIAAPECMDVHRRVRAKKEKEIYRPKMGNARENAAFAKDDAIQIDGPVSKKFGASSSPNFFHEPDGLLQADGEPLFDRATLKGHSIVSGVALWSTVNNAIYIRCVEVNRQRLKNWNLEDDIPM